MKNSNVDISERDPITNKLTYTTFLDDNHVKDSFLNSTSPKRMNFSDGNDTKTGTVLQWPVLVPWRRQAFHGRNWRHEFTIIVDQCRASVIQHPKIHLE